MEPIRVLYVNGGVMHRGGIESYMMNYYRNLDRSKIQIDFIVHGFQKGNYDDEIKSMGGRIYHVPVKSKNYIGNIRALRKVFSDNNYQIIHSHMDAMSYLVLKEAKKYGIPVRIAHSHNTNHLTNNKIKLLLNEHARKNIGKYCTHQFACSYAAGNWLFGEKAVNEEKVILARNAIEIDRFIFNDSIRKELREKLEVDDKFVIGHIGRMDYQKNHQYLLDIFAEVVRKNENSVLLLIGSGHLENEIKDRVNELQLKNHVRFMGLIDNVNEYLNALDVMVFPSHFEGLPVTLIEAQINSLMSIVSSNITTEVEISDRIKFIDLNQSPEYWANIVLDFKEKQRVRYSKSEFADYDIEKQVKILEDFYLNISRSQEMKRMP
nr:glycosyltransferase family 1 protein [Lysinibacillus timonensis]